MTLMTPITPTAATPIRHPGVDRAERLTACASTAVEMLAEAARALDLATTLPPDSTSGVYCQSRMRMSAAALLLCEIDDQCSDAIRESTQEIIIAAGTTDSDEIRDLAARLDAVIQLELYQIKLGELWDRYVS